MHGVGGVAPFREPSHHLYVSTWKGQGSKLSSKTPLGYRTEQASMTRDVTLIKSDRSHKGGAALEMGDQTKQEEQAGWSRKVEHRARVEICQLAKYHGNGIQLPTPP